MKGPWSTIRSRLAERRPVRGRRRFVPWSEVERLLETAPLDRRFARDIDEAVNGRTEDA